jgi:serpin B
MLIVLPKPGFKLDDTLAALTSQGLDAATTELKPTYVDLSLPRFDVTGSYDLVPSLGRLGMKRAVTKRADFSGIGEQLHIGQVMQNTVLDINEKGTVGAASTFIGMEPQTLSEPVTILPIAVRVNHPFFFAIQDRKTGLVLMEGVIVSPKA